jgi:hypothetical protein
MLHCPAARSPPTAASTATTAAATAAEGQRERTSSAVSGGSGPRAGCSPVRSPLRVQSRLQARRQKGPCPYLPRAAVSPPTTPPPAASLDLPPCSRPGESQSYCSTILCPKCVYNNHWTQSVHNPLIFTPTAHHYPLIFSLLFLGCRSPLKNQLQHCAYPGESTEPSLVPCHRAMARRASRRRASARMAASASADGADTRLGILLSNTELN